MSRAEPDLAFGPEWALLERLCVAADETTGALIRDPGFDWGELLDQALRHQLLPLVAHALLEDAHEDVVPPHVRRHLDQVLQHNRLRLDVLRAEAAAVVRALDARAVPVAATKGITFEASLYGGQGTRELKDIDFLIVPDDRERVAAVLVELGFEPGVYDRRRARIVPHDRAQHMRYVLNPDHLPRFARLVADPLVRFVYVDVANTLTWTKSPYQIPVEEALRDRREVALPGEAGTLPGLAPAFDFAYTVLYAFRSAWLEHWLELEQDVSLMKFGDIVRLARAHRADLRGEAFAALVERWRVAEPLAWVLEHVDRVFGTGIRPDLGLPAPDEQWLNRAHPSRGLERSWRGSMRERLHAKDRHALFEARETIDRP